MPAIPVVMAAAAHISLVLCTYNGARFLPAQLGSLLAQTRLPDEIIVCDDASTDASLALLRDFAQRARAQGIRVLLHRQPVNLGYVRNFSDALRRASGEVVFLCDQDDVWYPDKIARMADEFARRPNLHLLHTDAALVDADGQPLGCTLFDALELTCAERAAEHAGQAFEVLLKRNTVTGATAALRRSVIARALPVPDGWIHDEWLALCAALHGEVDCLEWPSIDYRQHGGNQVGMPQYSFWQRLLRRKLSKRGYMQRMAGRIEVLVRQHEDGGLALTPQQAARMRERLAHAHFRAQLPTALVPRVRGALREAASGRYRRHSSCLRSFISDVLDWR